jgi:hypothetical protein
MKKISTNLSFFLAINNTCNNVTEDCLTNPTTGNAICTCKNGYQENSTNGLCQGMKKCNN